jgi:DNA-binding GntR family transcriptional regulator
MIAMVFRGEIAAREHRQLLDSALKRDAATAQAVLANHIQDCVTYTLRNGAASLGLGTGKGPAGASKARRLVNVR